MIVAVMGISPSRWLRVPARIYTDLFRGLPAILTILLIGQGFARLSQSIFGPSPYPLGIIALSLIASAYIGEIFRAGIQSVDKGQGEACRALGMSYAKSMALVVVPQGIRRVLPALVEPVHRHRQGLLPRLLPRPARKRTRTLPRRPGRRRPLRQPLPLVMAGIFYLVITVPLTHLVNYFDNRFRTGRRRPAAPSQRTKRTSKNSTRPHPLITGSNT